MKQHRRSNTKPTHDGGPRYTWPVSLYTPPPRNPAPAPDTSWRGDLSLNPGNHVGGTLRNAHGWVLDLRGNAMDARTLALRVFVERVGVLLVEHDDMGMTADLTEQPDGSWPLEMTRTADDPWTGAVTGTSWRLVVTGARVSAGRLSLAADVERVVSNG